MARPKSYDPEAALDAAVCVFWEKGYGDTSIQDLVDGTGVQRYGLYETYGDKHGLFIAALRRYERVWVSQVIGDLESEDASLPQILGMFDRLKHYGDDESSPAGCLLCNTATELGRADRSVAGVVEGYVERLQQGFGAALRRARERGEVDRDLDPESTAVYLAGLVLGVSVYRKTLTPKKQVHSFIETALERLR